ncbi:Uncharacterised protein [Turicibacter sanguinis]|nr:Uncharacterised protein [Turicibacter sanguinis]
MFNYKKVCHSHTFIFFKIIYNLSEDKVVRNDLSYKTETEKTSFFLKMFLFF